MLFKNRIFINFILITCHVKNFVKSQTRVVGGQNVSDGEFPYIVSIRFRNIHICGGTIVSNRYILSAAHCLIRISPFLFTIVAGITSLSEAGSVYFVQFPIVHTFNFETRSNDIALLRTTQKILFNYKVQPVRLTYIDVNIDRYPVTMIGWGKLEYSGPISEHLQKIDLSIFDHHKCTREWKYINNGHICISTAIGRGSCVGDSGGPILANHYQIGIISFGQLCAVGKPDVSTKVFHYLDWINSYI